MGNEDSMTVTGDSSVPGGGTGTGGAGGSGHDLSSVNRKNYGGLPGPLSQSEIDDAINEVANSHRPVGGTPGKAERSLKMMLLRVVY